MLTPSVQSVLAGVPIPVMVIDANYRVIMTNGPTIELFSNDPLGMNAVTLLRQPAVLTAIDHAVRDGRDSTARFVFNGISGEIAYDFKAHPLLDEAGRTGGAVLSFEDQSQKEESELIRRDFIANVSHELRTPLTSLTGFIETLKTTARDDPDARGRFLEIMEKEAHRMGRMVRDLLSLSRVEADERVRPRDEVDLCAVIRSVVATLEGKLQDAQITVETSGTDEAHKVLGDRDQLTQLFLNLIENAIKYGGPGKVIGISVSETPLDQTLRLPAVRADISDQGEGIDPLHLPRLTERFYRIDDHRSREMGGTGLGLAIVKHIIHRHRGRLKISSKQGDGSVFSVILPTA
ncbi:MAG: two-component sensor histidine kinase [Paracoccaceae bacterium]